MNLSPARTAGDRPGGNAPSGPRPSLPRRGAVGCRLRAEPARLFTRGSGTYRGVNSSRPIPPRRRAWSNGSSDAPSRCCSDRTMPSTSARHLLYVPFVSSTTRRRSSASSRRSANREQWLALTSIRAGSSALPSATNPRSDVTMSSSNEHHLAAAHTAAPLLDAVEPSTQTLVPAAFVLPLSKGESTRSEIRFLRPGRPAIAPWFLMLPPALAPIPLNFLPTCQICPSTSTERRDEAFGPSLKDCVETPTGRPTALEAFRTACRSSSSPTSSIVRSSLHSHALRIRGDRAGRCTR